MSLLIESIKLKDGVFFNLFYHEQRMIRSIKELTGTDEELHLERFLQEIDIPVKGLYKCRIVYDETQRDVEFIAYQPKKIESLKVVHHNRISYEFKFQNRRTIDKLFAARDGCDDILIVKSGRVTDSSFSNIVFRKGKRWYTPWAPLLNGTMRQNLLDNNKIIAEEIREEDINTFESFKLINALLEFDGPEIDVSRIVV